MSQLQSLKARRERKVRAAMAALARQEAALDEELARVSQIREQLWATWRARGAAQTVVDQDAFVNLKIELGEYRLEDHALAERLDAIHAERRALAIERSRQQALLRQAIASQEKLKLLLES